MPRVISAFLEMHEHAQITLVVQFSREVVDAIVGERCDVGFIAQPNAYPCPRGEKIIQLSLRYALPFDHGLRDKAVIVPQDLEGECFISYPHAVASRQHIDSIFAAYGVERRMNLETQLSMPMCKFVGLGAGVALVNPISALEYSGEKVIFRPFEPIIEIDFSMLVPQQKKNSKFHESFLQHVRGFVAREVTFN
ncbi:LysR substrate-binding domain-containing protein [Pseudomonas sp. MPC6]|uniref:LysR substrate-binding domain-containing protein n=1 Tax=Pseudomonas sp. ALK-5 TaxID=3411798 RepID=UPI001E2D2E69